MPGLEILSASVVARAIKLIVLAALAGGVLVSIAAESRRTRLLAAYGYVVPGFVLTWAAGWILMKVTGRAVSEPWILAAMGASVASLAASFHASHGGALRRVAAPIALGGLTASIAVMSVRTTDPLLLACVLIVGLSAGAALAWPFARVEPTQQAADVEQVWRGLRVLTWLEGGSLLFLLFVSMPLRRAAGISLDAGTGVIGLIHGALVLAYLASLVEASRLLGWTRGRVALGVLAAFIPFAAFAFERRARPAA